ncbi:MAG: RNA 2',3'-cyclic phosphodiesterase [Planctomycetota bacterium]
MLRLFVACAPSAASRALLAEEGALLLRAAPALRVVGADDLHWTVAFLGATPDDRVEPLRARLAEVAAAQSPFEVRIEGLGAFPSYHRPRVLWAGLESGPGATALTTLARRVRRACLAAGCTPDANGTFEPHVTLARWGTRGPGAGGPPPQALEMLLTTGALQGTYTPELLSDLLLMVSEATSLSDIELGASDPDAGKPASGHPAPAHAGPGSRRLGSRYRVLASWAFGSRAASAGTGSAGGRPEGPS